MNCFGFFAFLESWLCMLWEILIQASPSGIQKVIFLSTHYLILGLAILSVMEPDRVALAISAGDHKAFKAASGVGPKLAQRIVLELKDKVAKGFVDGINLEDVGAATAAPAAQGAGQAIAALVSLGYSQSEAALAVSKIDASLPVEEIIKLALRGMAGRR